MPVAIDIVSDFVCPWCFIGTRRLGKVLAAKRVDAELTYRAFLLDPSIPLEGVDLRERLRAKYRRDPETMFARVEAAARETGIALDFGKVRRYPSTLRAHALVRRAGERSGALANALFDAYFLEGRDIGALDVLADLAAGAGMERDEALRVLEDEAEIARARDEAAEAAASGIDGVPFFVFGGKLAVAGAQPEAVFERALAMVSEAS